MNELKQLIKDLNNFDCYYRMSDSDAVYIRCNSKEKELTNLVQFYKEALTDTPEISLYRKKYFDIPFSQKEKIELKQLLYI